MDFQSWAVAVDVGYGTSTLLPQTGAVDHRALLPAWWRLGIVRYTMPLLWLRFFPGRVSWKNNPHQKAQESGLSSYKTQVRIKEI